MSYPPPLRHDYVANNLVWAILSTLLCCMPLGIVSIVYAARVDGKLAAGDIAGARADARLAANWAIASAVGFPVLILFLAALGGLGSLLGG